MARLERVVVFSEHLYHGNGSVAKWCRKITRRFGLEARHYAPVRTGRLVAGIRTSIGNTGPHMIEGRIGSTADYTMYVLRGTAGQGLGYIYTTKGYMIAASGLPLAKTDETGREVWLDGVLLAVGKSQGGPVIRRVRVHGQRANNFLEKAWRATARDHSSIRGVGFPLSF